jgi:hypothetical protein
MTDASRPPTFSGNAVPPPGSARSESIGTAEHSWRKPGRWRVAYCLPWVSLTVLLVAATVESPPTWLGEVTPGSIVVTAALVGTLALLPALGFVLVRGRVGLFLVAALGFLIAFVLFLALAAIHPAATIFVLVEIALVAAVVASVIAILVLLIISHETRAPSEGVWSDGGGIPNLDDGD